MGWYGETGLWGGDEVWQVEDLGNQRHMVSQVLEGVQRELNRLEPGAGSIISIGLNFNPDDYRRAVVTAVEELSRPEGKVVKGLYRGDEATMWPSTYEGWMVVNRVERGGQRYDMVSRQLIDSHFEPVE